MQPRSPSLPLPPPYRCADPRSFAENTLLVRLPEIARRVILENDFPDEINRHIEALIAVLPDSPVLEIDDPGAPDLDLWRTYSRTFEGKTWRELAFLVCENTFYRRILEATGYFQKGITYQVDPFLYQKKMGLETSRQRTHTLVTRLETWRRADFPVEEALTEAIESNLWGNQADLSLWPADAEETPSHARLHQTAEFLLVNRIADVVEVLLHLPRREQRVDFLIDNAGYELVCDLAFADLLAGRGLAEEVHFHLKAHPTFVSDAMPADVRRTVEVLQSEQDESTAAFGERLEKAFNTGILCLDEHFFWNSPLFEWEMPGALYRELSQAGIVISKGDANYRRLVGDLRWPETTPFEKITDYFPTRLAALRTAKSDVMVGLRERQVKELNRIDPTWRTNGKWGLVQIKVSSLASPPTSSAPPHPN
ncbi:MAG TPA: damage-control phosphatase ARMT1 family protein [Anaerolineaceae bacterium]|nr:damage-control phosphatase ARMT1 family protein [Anaerolineaceae bacterium]